MPTQLSPQLFFDLKHIYLGEQFLVSSLFELLGARLTQRIESLLAEFGVQDSPIIQGHVSPHALLEGPIFVAEGAHVGPFAYIQGPCFIAPHAEVRHGAFIRGSVYVGPRSVVGHTTEVKGSIFFDDAKAGHFAYVGDSILGPHVNLGAGTKLANLKIKGSEVKVRHPETNTAVLSGLRKLGSILGEGAQTGCNAVLSPGTLLLPKTAVMPCVHYHGTLREGVAK